MTFHEVSRPYPVGSDGSIVWPTPVHRRYLRQVILTGGHRRRDGSHFNSVVNARCGQCVLESELTYLMTMWAVDHNLPRRPRSRFSRGPV